MIFISNKGCGVSYFFFHDLSQNNNKKSDCKMTFSSLHDSVEDTTKSNVDLIDNIQ